MITIIAIFLHVVESLHDKWVILNTMGNSNRYANKMWHFYDAMQWMCVYLVLAVFHNPFWLIAGPISRLIVLQVLLNSFRGLPYKYLGTSGLDSICYKIMGERGTLVVKVLLLCLCLTYEISVFGFTTIQMVSGVR